MHATQILYANPAGRETNLKIWTVALYLDNNLCEEVR